MRFLLINNHCITDPTAGVTQSLRTIMEWLADAGHACQILTTARFESRVTFTIEEHLSQQNLAAPTISRASLFVNGLSQHAPEASIRPQHDLALAGSSVVC